MSKISVTFAFAVNEYSLFVSADLALDNRVAHLCQHVSPTVESHPTVAGKHSCSSDSDKRQFFVACTSAGSVQHIKVQPRLLMTLAHELE